MMLRRGQELGSAGGKIVPTDNVPVQPEEQVDQVAPDETGGAGDENVLQEVVRAK